MKILHIIPNLKKGGAERIVIDIVRTLNKNTSNQNYVEQPIANNKETKSETTFSEKSVENSVKRKEKLPIQKIVKSKSEEINPQKSNIKPKFCGDCGTSLASAKNFCANCGNKL